MCNGPLFFKLLVYHRYNKSFCYNQSNFVPLLHYCLKTNNIYTHPPSPSLSFLVNIKSLYLSLFSLITLLCLWCPWLILGILQEITLLL